MKATLLDLRRRPGKILAALDRNETVTLSRRGREIARIIPSNTPLPAASIKDSPAFGIWKDRAEMKNPSTYVRAIRKRFCVPAISNIFGSSRNSN